MRSQRERMLSGERYNANDPELVASRWACQRLLEVFNATRADDERSRHVLHQVIGSLGEGSVILPRFQCDYGTQITIGANCFVNYDAILLDCASIAICDNVSIGPRAQLVTALHPVDDHDARRAGWESASPIVIGDNVWLAAGVIVGPGVTIGANSVVGAGSVVISDIPAHVLAAGNPCRIIRGLT
ncbi:MAG: sugar O-acetyltransferase [Mycobacterium sp.]|uniref:sugar O-acetyltransferase n=1 Tax=Mycobacterium sp. TaxID=1785 RepID=UPI003C4D97D1